MKSDRSFTIESIKTSSGKVLAQDQGRYISSTPSGAAKKAFSQHKKSQRSLIVSVRETTRGSACKTFKYKVSSVKNTTEVILNGTPVVFKFKTVAHAM